MCLFTSDSQCPKILYFGLLIYINKQLNHDFLQCIALSWSKLTKMSDISYYVPCSVVIHLTPESYTLKMNILSYYKLVHDAMKSCT